MRDVPAFRRRRLPARLGRYLLVEQLGSGGMAEVFRAEQDGPAGFRKIVVIKVMHGHLAEDPRFVTMFQREANVAARLNHPNIVQVLELGEDHGTQFIAMEHVDGISLHRVLRECAESGTAPPRDVIYAAIAEAALGLHAAHTATDHDGTPLHVIHRDISPDNLMLSRDGVTKVVDFGIAKASHLGSDTKSGEIKGKLPYMAPEMLSGAPLDARVDLYALGVTLYVALTGERPFSGPTEASLMQAILTATPRRPREIDPTIPEDVDALVMRLLSKNPADRPADALAVHAVLGAATARRFDVIVPFLRELRARIAARPKPAPAELSAASAASAPSDAPAEPSTVTTPANAPVDATTSWADGEAEKAAKNDDTLRLPASPALVKTVTSKPIGATVEPTMTGVRRPAQRRAMLWAAAAALGLGAVTAVAMFSGPRASPDTAVRTAPPQTPTSSTSAPPADPVSPPPVAPAVTPPPSPDPPPSDAPRTSVAEARRIEVKAPPRIKWRTAQNRPLGSGSGTLEVSPSTTQLIAFDPQTGARTTLPVASRIDYTKLPTGTIDVRAFPYADVSLANKVLGTTPFAPVVVVVGRYTVRAVSDGKVQQQAIEVEAGKPARVSFAFE